jgi:hypothetical protein
MRKSEHVTEDARDSYSSALEYCLALATLVQVLVVVLPVVPYPLPSYEF